MDRAIAATPTICAPLRRVGDCGGLSGGSVWVLNNKTKMPYSDQFNLGVRKRFGDIQTSLTFSHIRSHNISDVRSMRTSTRTAGTRVVADPDGGCANGGDQWIIDNSRRTDRSPDCPATNGQLDRLHRQAQPRHEQRQGELQRHLHHAEKPFTDQSTWGFTTALTLQRARSNVAQELNSDEILQRPALGRLRLEPRQRRSEMELGHLGQLACAVRYHPVGHADPQLGPGVRQHHRAVERPHRAGAGGRLLLSPTWAACSSRRRTLRTSGSTFASPRRSRLPWGHELTADFEVFNVFNSLNRNYSSWGAGVAAIRAADREQPGRRTTQRAFQAGLRYKF